MGRGCGKNGNDKDYCGESRVSRLDASLANGDGVAKIKPLAAVLCLDVVVQGGSEAATAGISTSRVGGNWHRGWVERLNLWWSGPPTLVWCCDVAGYEEAAIVGGGGTEWCAVMVVDMVVVGDRRVRVGWGARCLNAGGGNGGGYH